MKLQFIKNKMFDFFVLYLLSLPISYFLLLAISRIGLDKLVVSGERYGHITIIWFFVYASIIFYYLICDNRIKPIIGKITIYLWVYFLLSFSQLRDIINLPWIKLSDIIFSWQAMFVILSLFYAYIIYCILQKINLNKLLSQFIYKKQYFLPLLVFLLGMILYSLLAIYNHNNFLTPARDVGIFDQPIWHLSRFEAPISTIRGYANLWADHFHPVIILIAPIFWIFNSSLALLILQAIIVSAGGVFVYLLTKKLTSSFVLGFGLSLAYLFYGGLQHAMNFGFYPEILTIGFIPIMLYGIFNKNNKLAYIALFLALGCKEDVGISLFVLGILLAIFTEHKKTCLIMSLISIIWSAITLKFIIPYYIGSPNYQYWSYDSIGSTPADFIKNLITNPLYAVQIIFNSNAEKFNSLLHIFGDFAFLPLLSPFGGATLPYLFENYLSNRHQLWIYGFHYQAMLAPYLFISSLFALIKLKKYYQKIYPVVGIMLIILVFISSYTGNYPLYKYVKNFSFQQLAYNKENAKILKLIPAESAVSAQNTIVPHLSHKEKIYDYPHINDAEYLLLSPTYSPFPFAQAELISIIDAYRKDNSWNVISENKNIILFKKQ
ncbi:MAG: hypothetical protein CEN89_252 [Candidatus Berkelbacteria bacterium Licking1014_7]|uniref:DUF2079 domain-containing protein n=1 Tax=Candidatus Berkelbacteria bacterium Licking1014_7 TaxID=2017147 RepID=A0A554LJW5_9BACT|nr:MAG: hypothetical protein CEN89_252 [Candidatus Berkelbacteria bacterium Licking1014_7]